MMMNTTMLVDHNLYTCDFNALRMVRHYKRLIKNHHSRKGHAEARFARVKTGEKRVINGHGGETVDEIAAVRRAAGMLDSRYMQ